MVLHLGLRRISDTILPSLMLVCRDRHMYIGTLSTLVSNKIAPQLGLCMNSLHLPTGHYFSQNPVMANSPP